MVSSTVNLTQRYDPDPAAKAAAAAIVLASKLGAKTGLKVYVGKTFKTLDPRTGKVIADVAEVATIARRMTEFGHRVLLVFYKVNPSDVTNNSRSYAAMLSLCILNSNHVAEKAILK
ncbi:hypothetical protein LINGRAHAP2_LOCUS25032 [Linum grandiflorum]